MWLEAGWRALAADPLWQSALLASVFTGVLSTLLSLALSLWTLSRVFATPAWSRLVRTLPALLAMPHAAFAIGTVAVLAPTGWLMRGIAPLADWQEPPAWPTVQDPWGLSLVLVLVLKETPFLLWVGASHLQRDDTGPGMVRALQLAYTLGYSRPAAWWRIAVPQLLPRLTWPLLAVLAYALTVVDVAQIIGPGAPPPLSVLAWQWLQSPNAEDIEQGTTAAVLLTLCLVAVAGTVWAATRGGWPLWLRRWWSAGVVRTRSTSFSGPALALLGLPYLAVMWALTLGSVTGVWRFPELWPQTISWEAWSAVQASPRVLVDTLSLGLVSAVISLVMAVAWLEWMPPAWDARLRPLAYVTLVFPTVLWVIGMQHLALGLGLDNRWLGVLMAHILVVLPYALIALSPAYQGLDRRLWHTASSLGHGRWAFLLQVKWPLLRAAMASALAIGFAVSVAQYLPTLYVGGGRISTVTTEAVTLSSGGQRSLSAAFAWLQWTLPALAFAAAAGFGRPRWRRT